MASREWVMEHRELQYLRVAARPSGVGETVATGKGPPPSATPVCAGASCSKFEREEQNDDFQTRPRPTRAGTGWRWMSSPSPLAILKGDDIPSDPGVYALYRGDDRMYVGKAALPAKPRLEEPLRSRRGHDWLALRRDVAEHLGIATAAEIKARRYQPTSVSSSTSGSGWRCARSHGVLADSHSDAIDLEIGMKREHKPTLTKR